MDKNRKNTPPAVRHRRLQTQQAVCREIWGRVVRECFGEGNAADRALAQLLKSRREIGSHDRRFISETVFAFFRYWGMLKYLLTNEEAAALRGSGDPETLSGVKISKLLLGAAMLGFPPAALPEAARLWANHLRVTLPANWNEAAVGKLLNAPADSWNDPRNMLPEWAFEYIDEQLDPNRVCEALKTRPPLWLRCQNGAPEHFAQLLADEGLSVLQHPVCKCAFAVLDGKVNCRTLASFRRGEFEIQDLASQAIGLVCAPKKGERWWDVCAGAGGKTLELAGLMENKGTVVATDIRSYKLEDLRKRARRAGFSNITTKEWDGGKPRPREQGKFDGVLVDAPCSCSGTWRRNPDGRWLASPEEAAELAEVQFTVLSRAAAAVKPGGKLVYATCSMFKCENGDVVDRFLAENRDFEPEPFASPLTGEPTSGRLLTDMLASNSDAMFAARFRRR